MRRFTLVFNFLLSIAFILPAQTLDLDEVVLPVERRAATFEELLVQLAWNNTPNTKALNSQKEIADLTEKITKLDWTRAVGFNIGFNRNAALDMNEPNPTGDIIFPRVSIGASLQINPLITNPANVKIAKEEVKIAEAEINQEKLKVRKAVLQRYKKYQLAIEVLKVRTQMEEDASASYKLTKELFEKNEATYENYNRAFTTYHNSVENRLSAETDVELAELEIEEYIGIPFDQAMAMMPKK